MNLYTDEQCNTAARAMYEHWGWDWDEIELDDILEIRKVLSVALDRVAPAIAARAKAEAWDEAAEAVADWMWNNPGPSGIPADPPRNPYADEIEAAP